MVSLVYVDMSEKNGEKILNLTDVFSYFAMSANSRQQRLNMAGGGPQMQMNPPARAAPVGRTGSMAYRSGGSALNTYVNATQQQMHPMYAQQQQLQQQQLQQQQLQQQQLQQQQLQQQQPQQPPTQPPPQQPW